MHLFSAERSFTNENNLIWVESEGRGGREGVGVEGGRKSRQEESGGRNEDYKS